MPPTAEHVLAAHDLLPTRYRLPLLTLDATGMRLSELEGLTWGDIDEPRGAVARLSGSIEDSARAVGSRSSPNLRGGARPLPCGRIGRRSGASSKASAATGSEPRSLARVPPPGVPAFSPHDLRHRRVSLLHLAGVPWARIGEHVGQRNLAVTANTYSHVLVAEDELDYPKLLG